MGMPTKTVRELIEMLNDADPESRVYFEDVYGDDEETHHTRSMVYGPGSTDPVILTNEDPTD